MPRHNPVVKCLQDLLQSISRWDIHSQVYKVTITSLYSITLIMHKNGKLKVQANCFYHAFVKIMKSHQKTITN